ncbi:piezo-type mechanosensitive ion channel component 2-like [Epinephelus moara]|uniref:piezo-type mechanosensitive ion channel component 2-like n=1 Tax=Epinephelus moara TaxID=300413 RepID=UPI00214E1189|nr:piezo-type mechanosensitive ion channel component 2-like [Epinephelus moara]
MPSELAVGVVFRVVLPLSLTAACVLRYNGFSLVYVLLLLLLPLLSDPSSSATSSGNACRCVTAVCVSSFLFLLLQSFFQLTTATLQPESNCTSWQKALGQLGLVSLTGSDAGSAVRQVFPDVGVLVVGLLTWRLIVRLNANRHTQPQEDTQQQQEEEQGEELMFEDDSVLGDEEEDEGSRNRILVELELLVCKTRQMVGDMTTTGGKVLLTVLLGLTGIMFPSLSSLPYLLCFQVLCTWWAWSGQVPPLLFRCVSVMSLLYPPFHFLLLYCYQLPSLQEAWPPNRSSASVCGLVSVVTVDCAAPWRLQVNAELSWFHFSSPLMLLLLYNTVASLWRNQLINGDGGRGVQNVESAISGSCDITTATSNLSDDVSGDMTAERRRELWRRAHNRPECRDVVVSSANDSPSDSFAPPTQSTALGLDVYSTPHYSLSQSDTLETCVFEGDGWEEEDEEEVRRRNEEGVSAASMAFSFLLKQSYICALIAMMAWPITYVSWLTCVLLLWSCVLWMMRERRRYTLMSSPWLVAYGNLLVILQYVYSFPSIQEVPGLFPKKDEPCTELVSKLLCLVTFWLLLRQALTEKRDRQADTQLSTITVNMGEEQSVDEALQEKKKEVSYEEVLLLQRGGGVQMEALVAVVTRMFVKYWIYVCGTMFFFVSFEGKIVLYKVIYMVMFLCCVALYQLNYERWRSLLRGFWVAVVVYSMLVLILIYTFQFPSSPHTWSYYTGLSTHRLEDVGLEKFSVPVLFTRIFIPAAFLLVCIVHLHYFHQPFLQLTDLKTVVDTHNSTITRLVHSDGSLFDLSLGGAPQLLLEAEKRGGQRDREEDTEERWMKKEEEDEEEEYPCMFERETLSDHLKVLVSWRLVVDRLSVLFLRLLLNVQRLQHLLWWLLELHIIKIVSSYIIWVSVKEVCVFNLLFVLCVAVALPCRAWRPLLSGVCTVWTCVVTVCKMLYQLNVVQPMRYSSNCTMPGNSSIDLSRSVLYSGPVDPAQWVGLRKTDGKLLDYLRYNLMMLALLAFEVTVYRHQELYRLRRNEVPPPTRTLFHDITRRHLDDSVLSCIKYFLNYFFYKFGLETCFLLAVNVIGQRMDLFAVGHAFGLISVLSRRSRRHIASVWPKYCYFLSGLMCFQYLLCIGLPPATCTDYPWRPPSSNVDSNVVKWLFLPDHLTPPNPLFLLYDFMLLLGASLQLQVFEEELHSSVQILAGDNCELDEDEGQVADPIRQLRLNTGPDFMLCRSYLDMMKIIIFSYMFWFVLTIIFITGTTRISIFCMGYLVACFYFLLVGGDLLLKPVKSILVYWDCLIGYNVFVITMKNILSILACGFIKSLVLNHCWLIQLFSLACTIKGYTKPEQQSSKQCELPSDEAGIIWDGVCFCFLLLQRRVFRSHYFLYVVLDLQNTQLLASRGAELFEASTVKAVRARLEVEKTSMDLLKRQRFNQNLVAQLWYFVKCVYFGLSAYQIRSGYPTRVLGNFLTKSYNYLNLFLFQGFRLVPFLTELRAVMDWVWTDTTLSLSSWICVEDVYAHCFVLKCWRESEKRYPQPRGQKKKRVVKYGMGGLIVLLLICIVWFPLLFMSLIKSVAGVVNRPLDVSLTITLGGFQPIFTMSAQQNQLKDVTEEDFSSFISSYSYTPSALQFLEAYGHEDVTVAELQGSSNSLWTISPPSRQYLSQVLNLDHFPLTVSWTVQRNLSLGAKAELASGKHVTYLDDETRLELIQLLNGTRTLPVVIQEVFPCFIRAPSDSNAKPIEQLYTDGHYKDILLALERSTNESREIQDWWIVDQPAASLVPIGGGASLTDIREAGLQLFVFSDKVSPPSLGFLAGYGIMGLYASVVLVIGKFVREFFSGISHSIMFEELPCVDRILKLCTDIFLVRETGELELEEELYAKLIFLYRSPETLIKWTRR